MINVTDIWDVQRGTIKKLYGYIHFAIFGK